MKSPLANLTSLERRFVLVVAVVVFIVLNAIFVWPRFKDWKTVGIKITAAQDKLGRYQTRIAQSETNKILISKLEGESTSVPPEDQAVQLLSFIQNKAIQAGVDIQGNQRSQSKTNNQFYAEHAQTVTLVSGETNLVNFLYSLGEGNSLTRVRDLVLRPDPPRQRLNANLKIVASYQKKPVTKAGVPAPTPAPTTPAKTQPATAKKS